MRYLLLIVLMLSGCASGGYTASPVVQARIVCQQSNFDRVREYTKTWESNRAESFYNYVVRDCMNRTLAQETTSPISVADSLYLSSAALYGFGYGVQGGNTIGYPNAFGPYGTFGPTWGDFNSAFSPVQQFGNQMLYERR